MSKLKEIEREMDAPKTLNGYPVIAAAPRRGSSSTLAVVIYRADHPHRPFVVASWGAWLEDGGWSWGDYCRDLIEAAGCFAHMTGQTKYLKREAS